MKKYLLMDRVLVVGIILLFVVSGIRPCNAQRIVERPSQPMVQGNIFYVGGEGPGNYSIIQDAVDNASDGDTVFVYHGIYSDFPNPYSCVEITKSINLIGENRNTTIINGTGRYRVINVYADRVHIHGFTIQNGGNDVAPGAGVYAIKSNGIGTLDDIKIYDNIITNNMPGIQMSQCSNSTIFNNSIVNNDGGCSLLFCDNCSIHDNRIMRNTVGINFFEMGVNVIEHNELRDNNIGISMGISQVKIRFNNFINNKVHAFFGIEVPLIYIFNFFTNKKQEWTSNYWDNWKTTIPKPILGFVIILISGPTGHLPLPIGLFPSIQFDKSPVQEPYNVP